jgi:transcriptional regulator with XRE-family HTH domain
MDKYSIGIRLRRQRERLSLIREDFAEQVGITPQFLAEIENGNKNMSSKTLFKICDRFSISADYLLLGRENSQSGTIISDIINNLPAVYIPLIEDMLKIFMQTIAVAKNEKNKG